MHIHPTEQNICNQLNFQGTGDRIKAFFERFDIARLGYHCSIKKTRGAPVLSLLLTMLHLPAQTNLYRHFKEANTKFQKDALYSLLRSPNIRLRRFFCTLLLLQEIFQRTF